MLNRYVKGKIWYSDKIIFSNGVISYSKLLSPSTANAKFNIWFLLIIVLTFSYYQLYIYIYIYSFLKIALYNI